ncbi:potassium-transporting ATPase subunit C [Caballeronia arvi]|uniref:Potassium-transporting ATPase KdpC subunit n=1 Tax=Caballeronia arvi TaxID=1777135 RepID=A0A158K545_9BURK|nr:potassium-transporting ATPase subunit KdpC [Caballeronia arvi]SAL76247.1 potassium-transporting ATPase subunit C [Caballeronia arvi]
MKNILRPVIVMFVALTIVTGLVYPAIVTALGQAAFHREANGSLIERDGKIVGSEIIGQQFDAPRYFWGRLSATTPNPYNAGSSGGSNLGPTNSVLADEVTARVAALRGAVGSGQSAAAVPVDLVTSSGSGLDPEISPAAALYQVERVAAARGMSTGQVEALVAQATTGRQFGLLGEPRVNVLKLNLALDGVGALK